MTRQHIAAFRRLVKVSSSVLHSKLMRDCLNSGSITMSDTRSLTDPLDRSEPENRRRSSFLYVAIACRSGCRRRSDIVRTSPVRKTSYRFLKPSPYSSNKGNIAWSARCARSCGVGGRSSASVGSVPARYSAWLVAPSWSRSSPASDALLGFSPYNDS